MTNETTVINDLKHNHHIIAKNKITTLHLMNDNIIVLLHIIWIVLIKKIHNTISKILRSSFYVQYQ